MHRVSGMKILVPARIAAQVREYRAIKQRSHEVAQKQRKFALEQSWYRLTNEQEPLTMPQFVEQLGAMISEREALDNAAARKYNALREAGLEPTDDVFTFDARDEA